MKSLAYSTYDFHALDPKHLYRRNNHKEETRQENMSVQNGQVSVQNGQPTPYYIDNNSIKNNNIKENNNSCSSCYKDAPDGAQPQPQQDFFVKEGGATRHDGNDGENKNSQLSTINSPKWEEVVVYAQEKMIPMDIVKKFFCYYESNGWKKIKKWKASLQYWVLKERHGRRDNLPAEALRSTTNEDMHKRIIAQQHAQREQAEKDYEAHREENEAARDAFFRRLRAGELTRDLAKK